MKDEEFLRSKDALLVIEKRGKTSIVIGAPHHAPGGVRKNIVCKEHIEADENTGMIARRVAERMNASSIIACCYHIDSNKSLGTDYCIQIGKWRPKYLIEIHGHAGRMLGNLRNRMEGEQAENGIEISSGSERNNVLSERFSFVLNEKMKGNEALKTLVAYGDFSKIRFTASNSASITSGNWKAIHIELPPKVRVAEKKLPEVSRDFIEILAETILEVCR